MIRRKTMFYGSAIVLLAGVLLISSPATSCAQGAGTGTVVGTIANCATGNGIDGVLVSTGTGCADVSQDGLYVLLCPAGIYSLMFKEVDYITEVRGVRIDAGSVTWLEVCMRCRGCGYNCD